MTGTASTLEELVSPLTEAEFLSILRRRKLTLQHGANENRFSRLLTWKTLLGMIDRGEHPRGLADFRIAKESVTLPADRWLTRSNADQKNKVDTAKVEGLLADGFSLIITPIENYAPPLDSLCQNIKSRLSEQVKVGVIVTTGSGGAFKLHYDPEDLIILQVEGSKRWQIYGPPVSNPVVGMKQPDPPPQDKPIFDEVLRPGDLLFLPAGNWHHCENGPGRSLHLGIFLVPPTSWHAMRAFTGQLLSEEIFRVPLTRVHGESDLVALEADIKSRLVDRIGQLRLSEFPSTWNKSGSSKADVTGSN